MSRQILTRSKTREYEAFFHEDIQQFKLIPPMGVKRKLKDNPYDEPETKRIFSVAENVVQTNPVHVQSMYGGCEMDVD